DNLREAFEKVSREYKENLYVVVNEKIAYVAALGLEVGRYTYKKDLDVTFTYSDCEDLVYKGMVVGQAVNQAKRWSDMPSNVMTPEYMASEAIRLGKTYGMEVEVLNKKQLKEMGAGCLVAVNQGSSREAHLITVKYNGNGNAPYMALVGKGITYDAGGYNIKTASMSGMKYDMCGAANMLAIVEACARLKLNVNVKAVIGTTENKIGPEGYVEGDILTSLKGLTVEVTNTDAEGRLLLADTMTYAQKEDVSCLIDMATLTGSSANALGSYYTAVFTNNTDFYSQLEESANNHHEPVWRMPLDQRHHKALKCSLIADLINCVIKPGKQAGCSVAAAFLEEFIEKNLPWIHLDIAGVALYGGTGTGCMIETLVDMIERGTIE
ncbi:MAG: leucyl aminopeptidase family protein, partial [Holdemanella sp.]|nr:leucyl aminopeptidase family protein [Holdemanella sp.]